MINYNYFKYGVKRKGYSDHKPIDQIRWKIYKKISKILLLYKKIKDDIAENNDN